MRFVVDVAGDRQYLIDFCKENPFFDFEILQDIINMHNSGILDLMALTLPIIRVSI